MNCGSSARMAGIMGVNERSNTTPRPTEKHNDGGHISPAFNAINGMTSSPMVDPFTLLVPRRSTNGMTDWRQKNSALTILSNLPSLPMHLYCTGDHDAQEEFHTRLGAHDESPPLLSHLAIFNLL
ncbi:hypothetical protein [Absidia glauca]|uniref:Ndc10 domain-containing protein n=1 Tax=Absidia glauca TaxID=4829 RepID=A0A168QZD0_ABSGL|nr:hypothetical protein [Absidia glauca]